jgi:hypothetical protein
MDGVYSIPSLIGLLSIPINFVFKFFWMGVASTVGSLTKLATAGPEAAVETAAPLPIPGRTGTKPSAMRDILPAAMMGGASNFDGCSFQGIGLTSEYAPQTLVVTATIFSYYMFDLVVNRGWEDAALTIVTFALMFGAETWAVRNCDAMSGGMLTKAGAALMEGIVIGGSGFALVSSINKKQLPSAVMSKHIPKPKGGSTGGRGGKCSAELEALKSATGQGGIGNLAASGAALTDALKTKGTGALASEGSCPAGTSVK